MTTTLAAPTTTVLTAARHGVIPVPADWLNGSRIIELAWVDEEGRHQVRNVAKMGISFPAWLRSGRNLHIAAPIQEGAEVTVTWELPCQQ